MSERYQPKSHFLQTVIADNAPLSGSKWGEANLRLLIELTEDADFSNRDWATFLLGQEATDTSAVRGALLRAATDEDHDVRSEAMRGLARRDPRVALPFVQQALSGDRVGMNELEAAEMCAHPSLIADLRVWAERSGDAFLDDLAADALKACESGVSKLRE